MVLDPRISSTPAGFLLFVFNMGVEAPPIVQLVMSFEGNPKKNSLLIWGVFPCSDDSIHANP